ncbi:MAG: DUF6675 family protein [Burkholderiales bacterium]|nr:DUF6675 family protein [Burkholderiales bacterium]
MRGRRALAAAGMLLALGAQAQAQPVPPCRASETQVHPAFGPLDGAPNVASWRDIDLSGAPACLGPLRAPMEVVIALAGRFRAPLSLEDMARRVGAISHTEGLRYWSVTDEGWRTLLSEAYAVRGAESEARRADFSAAEVLSGEPLYTLQRDTRTTGPNRYRLVGRRAGPNRIVVESANVTPLRFVFVELYAPEALRVVHILERLEPGVWAAYTVSAVRSGTLEQAPRSVINRAAAYYRYLAGVPSDRDPPLAP